MLVVQSKSYKQAEYFCWLLDAFYYHEDGGSMFLRHTNVRLVIWIIWLQQNRQTNFFFPVRCRLYLNFWPYLQESGVRGSVVEALCYKAEGRGFDSLWVYGFFNWLNRSSRAMALGSTQPLSEVSTRNLIVGKGRPAVL
jgi:hypothetical protein